MLFVVVIILQNFTSLNSLLYSRISRPLFPYIFQDFTYNYITLYVLAGEYVCHVDIMDMYIQGAVDEHYGITEKCL